MKSDPEHLSSLKSRDGSLAQRETDKAWFSLLFSLRTFLPTAKSLEFVTFLEQASPVGYLSREKSTKVETDHLLILKPLNCTAELLPHSSSESEGT